MKTNLNTAQMAAEYAAGSTITQIAANHSVSPSVVTRVFRETHVAVRGRGVAPKAVKDGKLQCTVCKEFKAPGEFYSDAKSSTGCASQCKECNKTARIVNYHKNKPPLLKEVEKAEYVAQLLAQNGRCLVCSATAQDQRNLGKLTLAMHNSHLLCHTCVAGIDGGAK